MMWRIILVAVFSSCSVFAQSAPPQPRSGIVLVDVDPSGKVTGVKMLKSTGDRQFDQQALRKFREWHFKPGTAPHVKIPVTFTATGASY